MILILAQNRIKLSIVQNPIENLHLVQAQFLQMADFEPPSFSLGLDFDLDSQPLQEPIPDQSLNRNAQPAERSLSVGTCSGIQEDPVDDDFETPSTVLEQPRLLKRLRRGSTSETTSSARKVKPKVERVDVDDEIEEFSEEERQLENVQKQQRSSMCSSSKLPLHDHGVLASQSSMQLKGIKKKGFENASASTDNVASTSKLIFPKLTISPVRKFQLIDSDSDCDEACVGRSSNSKTSQLHSSLNHRHCNQSRVTATTDLETTKGPISLAQNKDLWKDVCSEKNFHIPTPALEEVCEEYFRNVKDTDKIENCLGGCYEINSGGNNEQNCSLTSVPPAYQYYLHEDPRIRALVRARLPNFFPLGSGSNQENRQQNACTIDYMSKFNQGEGSKLAKQNSCKPSTSKRQKNVRNTVAEELSGGPQGWVNTRSSAGIPKDAGKRRTARNSKVQGLSQGSETTWVNPRSGAGIPKDAGKRRVQAVEGSAGHWYTSSDGRRVYVSKNGQELTGQIAYRQYRRESGAGFKRSKKKAAKKKAAAAKKK